MAAMHKVLLLGAGKIGEMIATLLAATGNYEIRVGDIDSLALERLRRSVDVPTMLLDADDSAGLSAAVEGRQSVISALSFRSNRAVAQAALAAGASYFDLTEDIETAAAIRELASMTRPGQIFMPQCGLAPGFISVLANDLARKFDSLDAVHMRVGALPEFPSNALNYNLTWSTDGLINEYCNPCQAIHDGRLIDALPLDGLESFSLDGVHYEAFNTSGGLGTLCETLTGQVRELNYRTVRYRGHRDLMAFLLQDLRMAERREMLKEILERALPITLQDVVVIFCNVTGRQEGRFTQWSDARKIYSQLIGGRTWSAIQVTTAAGICAALDLHVAGCLPRSGFVKQEQIDFTQFVHNRFGRYFDSRITTRYSAAIRDPGAPGRIGEGEPSHDQPDTFDSRSA
jgi:saccharopine dehydrogenase-like NADP-dependent oxidoreductase